MEEQLITYSTAKLAKEKGYKGGSNNIFTLHHSTYEYDGDPNHRESYKEGDLTTDSKFYMVNGEPNLGDLSNEYYTLYERSSQSLLQKWLRDVHKCHMWTVMTGAERFTLHFRYIDKGGKHWTHTHREAGVITSFGSHEEALEEGLQEALKLIK